MNQSHIDVTAAGLLAGEEFCRVHGGGGFDEGTPDTVIHFFIRDLLSEVFRVSGITLGMPSEMPKTPEKNFSEENQGTDLLLAFLAEPGFEGYVPEPHLLDLCGVRHDLVHSFDSGPFRQQKKASA